MRRNRPFNSSGTLPITSRSTAVTSLLSGAKFPATYGAPVLFAEGIVSAVKLIIISFVLNVEPLTIAFLQEFSLRLMLAASMFSGLQLPPGRQTSLDLPPTG